MTEPTLREKAEQVADDDYASEANGYAYWSENHSCGLGRYGCCGGGKDINRAALRDAIEAFGRAVSDAATEAARKEIAILKLAVPLEDELSDRIDEMCKHLATEQGFTLNGIARLLIDCQRRMASDWTEIGRLRRECKAAAIARDSIVQNWFCKLSQTKAKTHKQLNWDDCENLLRLLVADAIERAVDCRA